jgi:hypothetical protein
MKPNDPSCWRRASGSRTASRRSPSASRRGCGKGPRVEGQVVGNHASPGHLLAPRTLGPCLDPTPGPRVTPRPATARREAGKRPPVCALAQLAAGTPQTQEASTA